MSFYAVALTITVRRRRLLLLKG